MRRHALTFLLFLAVSSGEPVLGDEPALPGSRRVRIVVLMSQDIKPYQDALKGFRKQLEEMKIPVDLDLRRLEGKAQEGSFDLMLALGTPATKLATAWASKPVVSGLALRSSDLGPPSAMTGVYLQFPVEVELQSIRRFLPRHRRVGVVYSRIENQDRIDQALRVAGGMSLQLVPRPVDSPREIPQSLKSLDHEAEVLWGVADETVLTPQTAEAFLLYSMRNHIPFIGLSSPWVQAGALYALDRDYEDVGRQCGEMAARILNGESVGSVLREPPRKVRYSINLRTARRMNLAIPGELLRGAVEVIE